MKKIVTIIGARPQIIKASAISRCISSKYKDILEEVIIHTGQHYDENMSEIFFGEMNIPRPKYNLNVGSASHGAQTARMIEGIEEIFISENPSGVIVYGDTNSTLAAAIAASKLGIPIFHIEAGLRSYNMQMPEEINRLLTDHVSRILFCPTNTAFENLLKEGFANSDNLNANFKRDIYMSGDVMYDNCLFFTPISENSSLILNELNIDKDGYILVTIHRNNNTDDNNRLNDIIASLLKLRIETNLEIVFPIHPRTSKVLKNKLSNELYKEVASDSGFHIIEPRGFLDTISLLKNSKIVLTDSGGLQKESFFFKKPCVILRSESEWIELVHNGNAIIADANPDLIINGALALLNKNDYTYPMFYGNGDASGFILDKIFSIL